MGALGRGSIGRGGALERGEHQLGREEHWEGGALGKNPPFPMRQCSPSPMFLGEKGALGRD